jgi:hypothetical protein
MGVDRKIAKLIAGLYGIQSKNGIEQIVVEVTKLSDKQKKKVVTTYKDVTLKYHKKAKKEMSTVISKWYKLAEKKHVKHAEGELDNLLEEIK